MRKDLEMTLCLKIPRTGGKVILAVGACSQYSWLPQVWGPWREGKSAGEIILIIFNEFVQDIVVLKYKLVA